MTARVCVDASLALRWLLPTEQDPSADSLLKAWDETGTQIVSAPILDVEVTSAIRRYTYLNKLLPQESERAYRLYRDIGIIILAPAGLSQRAWALAAEYNYPTTYDMQYLALAEFENCELWTADRSLANVARETWVKWVGEYGRKAPEPPRQQDGHDIPRQDNLPSLGSPRLWQTI